MQACNTRCSLGNVMISGTMIRRHTVIDVLRELGVRDVETRDPIEWERLVAR